MPRAMAGRLIDEADAMGISALKFNWRGESTLHREFSEIVSYAHGKGFVDLLLNTNGQCPDAAMRGMLLCTKVSISLDTMDPRKYQWLRRGGVLKKAKDTISRLLAGGHTNVCVRRIVGKENQEEPFIDHVRAEWGQAVKVAEHFVFTRTESCLTPLREGDPKSWPRRYCGQPNRRLVVGSNGEMAPCCVDYGCQLIPAFRYPTESLATAWKAIAEIGKGSLPDTCKHCVSYSAYDVPERELLKDQDGKKACL